MANAARADRRAPALHRPDQSPPHRGHWRSPRYSYPETRGLPHIRARYVQRLQRLKSPSRIFLFPSCIMPALSSIQWPVWAASPLGRPVLRWEQAQFDTLVGNIFGYHAVQLGLPELNALRENRISCRTLALGAISGGRESVCPEDSFNPSFHSTLQCDFLALPLATQSIDLLALPHALELTREPHQLLREAARALHPLIALSRLKDWLKLLGLQLNQGRFGIYRPPFRAFFNEIATGASAKTVWGSMRAEQVSIVQRWRRPRSDPEYRTRRSDTGQAAEKCSSMKRWPNRGHFLETAGHRWWPIFGAVYIITAVKRAHGVRLIGPAQLNAPSLLPAPVSPTSREAIS